MTTDALLHWLQRTSIEASLLILAVLALLIGGAVYARVTSGIVVDTAPAAKAVWYVLNKPAGVLTSKKDPKGRPTVFAHVPPAPGLTYVGRLDYLTEGVLLFTTDGTMAHRLTHPSFEVERTYAAYVKGDARGAVRELREAVSWVHEGVPAGKLKLAEIETFYYEKKAQAQQDIDELEHAIKQQVIDAGATVAEARAHVQTLAR